MRVKFKKDYKHASKTFHKGDICEVFKSFGEKLLKKKVVTDILNKSEVQKLEEEHKNDNDSRGN